ncbi:MAG: tetrahydromethanopterin S-methyltransferase subunit D [Methanosphaera sp. rholeuAM270]|nr:MAG: tetrahydromethanopterin S-methyltransferase subunit D [Methanosphaera sp. rholeuAM270]
MICLVIASMLIGVGVHFVPVGGAPAALSTSAGIPTGAPMITIGMGITGLLSAVSFIGQPEYMILLAGAIGSMIMISVTIFFSNIIHVYGVGVPIATNKFKKDPFTSFEQEDYVSPGTNGHGIPTVSFISGMIGAFLSGLGGSLAFNSLYSTVMLNAQNTEVAGATIATIMSLVLFFIVAVIASYNIGGTIQGFYDDKFKEKILYGILSSFIVSIVIAIAYVLIVWGLIYG